MKHLRPAVVLTLLLLLLGGLIYPAVILSVGQLVFPEQANGSLLRSGGRVVGSALIGQTFRSARYFHVRAQDNKSPQELARVYRAAHGLAPGTALPADAVSASASGIEPHISPRNAELQAPRVARARGLPLERVRELILRHTEGRVGGVLGQPRVTVLPLNLALDKQGR